MNFMRRRRGGEMGNSYERRALDGGFDAVFDEPLPEELTCCICFLAFREPMQLSCGHQYCRSCLDKYSKKQGREYTCPTDRLQVAANKIFSDKALERRVLSLGVSCGNAETGCKWSGELRGLEEHMVVCAFTTVECRMCNLKVLETVLEDHMSNQCGHRVLSCGLCQVDYLFKDEHHHNEVCDRWPVTCTSCNAEVLRGDMAHHILHKCAPPSSQDEEGDEGSTDKCGGEHGLRAALARINILEERLQVAEEKNSVLENQVAEQKDRLSKHVEERQQKEEEMNDRMLKMEEQHQQVLARLANITTQLRQSETDVQTASNKRTDCGRPTRVSNVTPSAPHDGQSSPHRKPSSATQDDHPSPCRSVPQLYESGTAENYISTKLEEKRHEIPNLYSLDAEEPTSIVEQEQPELAFLWKVSRYTQKLTEARHTHTYIHSSPFFTWERGYKLRLQAWLNGHGMGKNTCISLYAQLMKGPYDDELRWPYRLKTTVSILNQRDEAKHRERTIDVGREVILDEWTFGRPMSDTNEAFGNGTALITHRNALSNGYVVDDCVYFRCQVESDDNTVGVEPLSHPLKVQHTATAEDTECCIF